jgi:hypothetical protein
MLSLLTNGVIGKGGNFLLVVDLSLVSLLLLVHHENLSKFPKKSNVIIRGSGPGEIKKPCDTVAL